MARPGTKTNVSAGRAGHPCPDGKTAARPAQTWPQCAGGAGSPAASPVDRGEPDALRGFRACSAIRQRSCIGRENQAPLTADVAKCTTLSRPMKRSHRSGHALRHAAQGCRDRRGSRPRPRERRCGCPCTGTSGKLRMASCVVIGLSDRFRMLISYACVSKEEQNAAPGRNGRARTAP